MGRSIAHLLVNSAEVWRRVTTPDGAGNHPYEYARILRNLPCRAAQKRERQMMDIAARETSQPFRDFYFAPEADVRRHDYLRVLGETYEVQESILESERTYRKASCILKDNIPGMA